MKEKLVAPLLLLLGILAPIAIYLVKFHSSLSSKHDDWGDFGAYLSGVYGSFAFLALVYTTQLTQKQFRVQSEDSVFYKLFDSLQYRIQHSSITVDEKEVSAHKSLKRIAERMCDELSAEAVDIGRRLLCDEPETIAPFHFASFFEKINNRRIFKSLEDFRTNFIAAMKAEEDPSERWELVKSYIGSRGDESASIREALQQIGSIHFYKIPFERRKNSYSAALHRILQDHGEFLDGYFRTVLHIAEVASGGLKRREYSRYMQSQLTRYEVVILFYMIAGSHEKIAGADNLKALGVLNRIRESDCQCLMIDWPSEAEIDRELEAIFETEA